MNTHEVLRPFEGERRYKVGEQVNASEWRNTDKLVDQRYLRQLPIVVQGADVKRAPGRPANQ